MIEETLELPPTTRKECLEQCVNRNDLAAVPNAELTACVRNCLDNCPTPWERFMAWLQSIGGIK